MEVPEPPEAIRSVAPVVVRISLLAVAMALVALEQKLATTALTALAPVPMFVPTETVYLPVTPRADATVPMLAASILVMRVNRWEAGVQQTKYAVVHRRPPVKR